MKQNEVKQMKPGNSKERKKKTTTNKNNRKKYVHANDY